MFSANGQDAIAIAAWRRGWDTYERRLPAFYAASIRDGDTVIDAGANTGYYALLAASVATGVHVHALEPYPPVADLLDQNISMNPQGRQVLVHRIAVDNTTGRAELHIPLGAHALIETSASIETTFRDAWSHSVVVPRTTIDLLAESLARVDVMKVDVECLEDRVLEGAFSTLTRHRPIVFYEVLDCDDWHANYTRLDGIRQAADYVSVRLREQGAIISPSVGYDEPWRNQALWPAERLADLRQVCARLRYNLQ
ncbi:MAG TPA: FkbM family methyltransferase [Jatrophihabitantaceae bacterium]|jgi:FkbM family methyltransferase